MRTLDTMTSPWFFYVSTPQTRTRLVHRMMPETRFTSIFSSQSALSNHYCRFVFPPPARLMRMSPGLTGFLAFRLKRCIPLKMSFSGGSLFWPITEASARKRANVCIQTGCSVVCSEEVHVQHWLLWTMAARYYEIRDVDV